MAYLPSPPVKVGDEFKVMIECIGTKKDGTTGDGVTHLAKFTIFVPGTVAGQEVKIRITKVLERYAFAEVIQ